MSKSTQNLIVEASMKGRWVGIWVIRKYATSPAEVANAVDFADRWGVEVKGNMNYSENKEFSRQPGTVRAREWGM